MRNVFRKWTIFVKAAWSKWWVRWSFFCIGGPLLLLVTLVVGYLICFNWLTEKEAEEFERKWEPLMGSFKREKVYPTMAEEVDLAKNVDFKRVSDWGYDGKWNVMGLIGKSEEEKGRYLYHDEDGCGSISVHLQEWYLDGEGKSDVEIAELALKGLREEEAVKSVGMLEGFVEGYSQISSSLSGWEYGGYDELFAPNGAISLIAMSRLFAERAYLHAVIGDSEAAMRDLERVKHFELMAARNGHSLVGFLVEEALRANRMTATRFCMQRGCFSREQLLGLLGEGWMVSEGEMFAKLVKGEYAYAAAIVEYMEAGGERDKLYGEWGVGEGLSYLPDSIALKFTLPCCEFYLSHVCYPGGVAVDRFTMNQWGVVNGELRSLRDNISLDDQVVWKFGRIIARQMVRVIEARGQFEMYQLAVACEVYKLDHGSYPKKLSELVPQYVKSDPMDAFDLKRKLAYQIGQDGRPWMYMVGEDEVDNGGMYGEIQFT